MNIFLSAFSFNGRSLVNMVHSLTRSLAHLLTLTLIKASWLLRGVQGEQIFSFIFSCTPRHSASASASAGTSCLLDLIGMKVKVRE
jgi:hypothetical protein